MSTKAVPPKDFLIANFILDLEKEFSPRIPDSQTYYVNLLTEIIYTKRGNDVFRVKAPVSLFTNLSNFKESYHELVSGKEVVGFLVGDMHFLPEKSFENKRILKFRKNKNFLTEKMWREKKINYYLLEKPGMMLA